MKWDGKTNLVICLLLHIPCIVVHVQPITGTKSKTNIIYIYADDMGYSELGCYGQ